jgi:acetyl-CoA carboxylase biotin carboxyl carrier protein
MAMQVQAHRRDDGKIELRSPGVGLWRRGPGLGDLVRGGAGFGRLEVLGQLRALSLPEGVMGIVLELGEEADLRRRPVAYDDLLAVIDPEIGMAASQAAAPTETVAVDGLWFTSPSSGRYYVRPAPDKPPFVEEGAVVKDGDPIGVLEVMKTFTRLRYGGDGLPSPARVVRILPSDGDDIAQGERLIELAGVSDA